MERFRAPLQWEGAAVVGALLLYPLVAGWLGRTVGTVVVGLVVVAVLLVVLLVRRRTHRDGGS